MADAAGWMPLMRISDGVMTTVCVEPPLLYTTVIGRPAAAAVAAWRSVDTSAGVSCRIG